MCSSDLPFSQLLDSYTAKNPWVITRIQQIVAQCAALSGSASTGTIT